MRMRLCDFGLSHEVKERSDLVRSPLCEIPNFVGPERFSMSYKNLVYAKKVDIWSHGTIVHAMMTSIGQLNVNSTTHMFRGIHSPPFTFPAGHCLLLSAPTIIKLVLVEDPGRRTCATDALHHSSFIELGTEKKRYILRLL